MTAIQAAQQRLQQLRAQGVRFVRPQRRKALEAYYRDFFGVDDNKREPGEPTRCMAELKERMQSLKGQSLGPVIENICFECVGGDDDPGPKLRVRDCGCMDCPLRSVRPWQRLKGRARRSIASADY